MKLTRILEMIALWPVEDLFKEVKANWKKTSLYSFYLKKHDKTAYKNYLLEKIGPQPVYNASARDLFEKDYAGVFNKGLRDLRISSGDESLLKDLPALDDRYRPKTIEFRKPEESFAF